MDIPLPTLMTIIRISNFFFFFGGGVNLNTSWIPEIRVILFLSSGLYSSPIFLGGKGISGQALLVQAGSSAGIQDLFQPHSTKTSEKICMSSKTQPTYF